MLFIPKIVTSLLETPSNIGAIGPVSRHWILGILAGYLPAGFLASEFKTVI
jgi:hypothetical protein